MPRKLNSDIKVRYYVSFCLKIRVLTCFSQKTNQSLTIEDMLFMQYEQLSIQHILMHHVTERTTRYRCVRNTNIILTDSRLTHSICVSLYLSVLNLSICEVIYVQRTQHNIGRIQLKNINIPFVFHIPL